MSKNNHEIARKILMEGIKGVLPGKLITDLVSVSFHPENSLLQL